MRKSLKKLAITVLCIFMLPTSVFAESENKTEISAAADVKIYTLTLEQAIDMALKDNPQLASFEAAQRSNRINLDAAQNTKRKYKNAVPSTSNYELMYIKKGYYIEMYEMLMRLNEKETEQAKASIAYNTTSAYFNYKIAQELCNVAENAYNLANENYNNVNKRFELGMIAEIDLNNAHLSVDQSLNTLESYKRNRDTQKENLKIYLQLENENCDFVLTDTIECDEFSSDIAKDIETAAKSRYDITALKENYELAQKYFEYTKPLSAYSAKYQTAQSDFISKEYSYNNNKNLIMLSVKNSYNNVLNSADNLKIAEKSTEIAFKRYEINKVKFENGMITNSDLTASLNEYSNSKITLENAKLSYKLAVEKYSYDVSIGLK